MGKTRQEVVSYPGLDVRPGSIRLQFTTADGVRHKRTYKVAGNVMLPTAANIKAAMRTVDDIKEDIRRGRYDPREHFPDDAVGPPPDQVTVGQQLDTWFDGLRVANSTKKGYESGVKFWRAAPADKNGTKIADLALVDLRLSHLRFALAQRPDLKGKTINNYLGAIRPTLELAVDDGLLSANPAGEGKKLRAKVQKVTPDPFTRAEAEQIISSMSEKYNERVVTYCEFWFFTGLRTSEINGLRWGDIDFRKGSAHIHHALVRGEEKDTTKTDTARDVHLNSRALGALTRQKKHTFLAGDHVFTNPTDGQPWNDERDFRRSFWTPTLKRLGIRYRRPYQMRHTFATMMLMADVNHALAAKTLGHSMMMFQTKYAKWIDDGHEHVHRARLEAFIGHTEDAVKKAV